MKLVNVEINGFRRLKDAKINLDNKLIAIVGPNEAGKTSLLQVLSSLEDNEPFLSSQLTRGTQLKDNHRVVRARFLLNDEERSWIKDTGGKGEPKWYVLNKLVNGRRTHHLEPKVYRDKSQRSKVSERLLKLLNMASVQGHLDYIVDDNTEDHKQLLTIRDLIEKVNEEIGVDSDDLSTETLSEIKLLIDQFIEAEGNSSGRVARSFEISRNILDKLLETESQDNPYSILLEKISNKQPPFLLFSDEDRNLSSDYSIDELDDHPLALRNLLDLADIDYGDLSLAIQNQDHGKRETIVENANIRLREVFSNAWNQYKVFVRFQIEPDVIRILLPSANTYSEIAERSDGLKSFIALYAFTFLKSEDVKPILLIDEAEAHLHYDAQVDLIKVFQNQTSASQIIYTTHSVGCLPEDYGRSIRVVNPNVDNDGNDLGISEISNSFWNAGPGFSPLLFAMGAGILASIRAKRVVFTEGASDFILLPYLLREVFGEEYLNYQIAPGLSSASRLELQELNTEAPLVSYFVDGDHGGKRIANRLIALGIPNEKIIRLDDPFTIEDMVELTVYLRAINEELRRSYGNNTQISKDDINTKTVLPSVNQWCHKNNIPMPNKVKVACHVVSMNSGISAINPKRKEILGRVYNEIKNSFK